MSSKGNQRAGVVKGKERFVSMVLLLFFWMSLSLPHSLFTSHGISSLVEHLLLGIPLAYLVTRLLTLPVLSSGEIALHRLPNILRLISYAFYLVGQMLIAGFDVARRVMRSQPDISPGLIKVETPLDDDLMIALNANSITLTPGTITIDVKKHDGGCTFWVHSISKEGLDSIKADKGFVDKIVNIYRR